MSVDAILEAIRSLTPTERADLDARLAVESQKSVPELAPELETELRRRLANAKDNPSAGYTWEEVVAYVKRKK